MAYRYPSEQQKDLERRAATADLTRLAEARDYLMQVLTANHLGYAFMGGYSLYLRRNPRPTGDLDVAVQATMQQIRQVVDAQARLMVPNGPTSGVIRVFVKCGPNGQDLVEVDLILPGTQNLGAPANIPQATEIIEVNVGSGMRRFPVLNLGHILVSKLNAYAGRRADKDLTDIAFLTSTYPQQIRGLVTQHSNLFPYQHRALYIAGLAQAFPVNVVRRNKFVLGVA